MNKNRYETSPGNATITNRSPFQTPRGRGMSIDVSPVKYSDSELYSLISSAQYQFLSADVDTAVLTSVLKY